MSSSEAQPLLATKWGVDWAQVLFEAGPPAKRWRTLFDVVAQLAQTPSVDPHMLEMALSDGDRLLAEAAWDLWQAYPLHAPRAAAAVHAWWTADVPGGLGRALLIVDALSLRELQVIVRTAKERQVPLKQVSVYGSEVPSDTDAFARALGLNGRADLKQSGYGRGFVLAGEKPETEVTDQVFEGLAGSLNANTHLVYWHSWLDDLVHNNSKQPDRVMDVARRTLSGQGFWQLVDALRQGRELLIVSDHGYAVSRQFGDLQGPIAQTMKSTFGALRYGVVSDQAAIPQFPGNQPLCVLIPNGQAAVIGRWKWPVGGGFPHVGHGGLTLPEVCVPFVIVEAKN